MNNLENSLLPHVDIIISKQQVYFQIIWNWNDDILKIIKTILIL